MQSAVLVMIDSVRSTVCPSVCHSPVSCENDSSYSHCGLQGRIATCMALVSSRLPSPLSSKENVGSGDSHNNGLNKAAYALSSNWYQIIIIDYDTG